MRNGDPLKKLAVADPDLVKIISAGFKRNVSRISSQDVSILVEEILWSVSMELSFGRCVARGYADLIGEADSQQLDRYRKLIRRFGSNGPTLGRIMAVHLVPVLKYGDGRFLKRFLQTIDIMQHKGTYTLKDPLDALSKLLNEKAFGSASAYVDLLGDTFAADMSYVKTQHFAYVLPRAVMAFSPSRRIWQIEALRRIIQTDFRLADAFLDGMEKGLYLLSKDALDYFVSLALDELERHPTLTAKFLSLESKLGFDTYSQLQVTVPFSEVQYQLNRYLRARTGLPILVRPVSELPKTWIEKENKKFFVCSDGKFIYLPDEMSKFTHKFENVKLFKCLTRLEAGLYEFNTYDFDLEKALERCKNATENKEQDIKYTSMFNQRNLSDMEIFFSFFPVPALASDLFTIFEHGRLRLLLDRHYPGLVRQVMPVLEKEAICMLNGNEPLGLLFWVYLEISLGLSLEERFGVDKTTRDFVKQMSKEFEAAMDDDQTVETCAGLVMTTYEKTDKRLKQMIGSNKRETFYQPMQTPFDRKLRPDFFFHSHHGFEQIASELALRLKEKGLKVYKADIRRHLISKNGMVSHEDLEAIIRDNSHDKRSKRNNLETTLDLSWLDLSGLLGITEITPLFDDHVNGSVFWYKEWDCNLHDYLSRHSRVIDRSVEGCQNNFYENTLSRYSGLVKTIRYAFKLLKPEGLQRLRQWVEGDEFDYRALLDFVLDKKAGKIPSDRLYIKRIKQTREVAVLLLVDLSRSTFNTVCNSKASILDIEKEAIVLFCEALQVVGDTFAIAGFSSTGRLGVDYMRIKDFEEQMDDTVKCRINAMTPHRNTRMGAAIRHAVRQLEKISSKIRLLIILGDGFPNDLDYKHHYAIADTQKAIFEARSKNIFAHAITVQFAGDPKLDELYGNVHHNVIADVCELPDKLLRIYSSLTRH